MRKCTKTGNLPLHIRRDYNFSYARVSHKKETTAFAVEFRDINVVVADPRSSESKASSQRKRILQAKLQKFEASKLTHEGPFSSLRRYKLHFMKLKNFMRLEVETP